MPNNPERRAYQRYPIHLGAHITMNSGEQVPCTVADFCRGGLFLRISGAPLPTRLGDAIHITLDDDKAQRYTLFATVARMVDGGLGVAFERMDEAALRFLFEHREASAEPQPLEQKAAHLEAELAERSRQFLSELVVGFVRRAHHGLSDSDELSRTNWRGLVEAQEELAKRRDGFIDALTSSVLADFRQGAKSPQEIQAEQSDGGMALSLVDEKEFQDWLNITSLSSRLNALSEETLFALEQRLGQVLGYVVNANNDPLGPAAVCRHFHEQLSLLSMDEDTRPVVFKAFEDEVMSVLGPFYERLNRWFVEQGVLPKIERKLSIVKPPTSVAPRLGEAAEAAVEPAEATSETPGQNVLAQPVAGSKGSVAEDRNVAAGAGTMVSPAVGVVTAGGAGSGFAAARELLHLERGADRDMSGAVSSEDAIQLSIAEILDGLSRLQREGLSLQHGPQRGASLVEQLTETLGPDTDGAPRVLPTTARDSLEVTERLFSSIHSDPITKPHLKGSIEGLQLPLLRTVVQDEKLLEDREHPVQHVLNTADRLSQILPATEESVAAWDRVEAVLGKLAGQDELKPDLLAEAAEELTHLYHEREGDREQRIVELAARCEKEERLQETRLEVLGHIDGVFAGEPVPVSVLALMDAGWKNLLMNSFIREGAESDSFRNRLAVIEQLDARLKGQRPEGRLGELSNEQLVRDMLASLRRVNKDADTLLKLEVQLNTDLTAADIDPGAVAMHKLPSMQKIARDKWRRESFGPKPAGLRDVEWKNWLDRTRTLSPGEMVSFHTADGKVSQQQLAWIGRESCRYVFLGEDGEKGKDLRIGRLARQLADGEALVLEGWEQPLMDRAAYAMLQSLHEKMLDQANHDPLTGLLNRRAFERHVEGRLPAQGDGADQLLCVLDMDRFNVINTTCGHEAGDVLVAEIGRLLRKEAGSDATIGRAGGDEFALHFEKVDLAGGLKRIEQLQRAIRDYRYECEGKAFSVSASFGVVPVGGGASLRTLLSAADSALFAAKEGGRDRIETFTSDNKAISRRGEVMSWVGRINKLFDAGLIKLKCQKIAPLANDYQRPHYEILLKIRDEEGNPVDVEDFIVAAETYNRIHDIDHWVIGRIIDWLTENRSRLGALAGISVNLSASSITNQAFMDELLDKLASPSVPSQYLIFEITETGVIDNLDFAVTQMRRLKKAGVRLAIDDFGSGQASYNYVKSMPVDFLKIDGSFIRELGVNAFDYAVVRSICEMGHAIGKKVIAEYAENSIILRKLEQIGIDFVQGYGVEKPIDLEQLVPSLGA